MRRIGPLFVFLLFSGIAFTQEVCDNAIDDDGDGFVDLNDSDCSCGSLIEESLIPNPSFEERACCPSTLGMLDCAVDWVQASTGTSDYYNTCDIFVSTFFEPAPLPLPGLPGGEGYVGGYAYGGTGSKEYVGACLETPMLAGVEYTLQFFYAWGRSSDFVEFTLFGTPNCTDLPWPGIDCPVGSGDWTELGTTTIEFFGFDIWQEVIITFIPAEDIYAISLGGDCDYEAEFMEFPYFYIDELTLVDADLIYDLEIEGGWCSGDLVLTAFEVDDPGTWQWFKDGVALIDETSESLSPIPYGEGRYDLVFFADDYCLRAFYQTHATVTADFELSNTCLGIPIEFTNTSVSDEIFVIDWEWDFGDDTNSDATNPTKIYDAPGIYEVVLIAQHPDVNCNDTIVKTVEIVAKPETDFLLGGDGVFFNPITGLSSCTDNPIQFTDNTLLEAPYEIEEWFWDFGDGETSSLTNPLKTYTTAGEFTISLITNSAEFCMDSIDTTLYIFEIDVDFSVLDACHSTEVNFDNTTFIAGGFPFENWSWNFGDGGESSAENPSYTFNAPGDFEVELIGISTTGCTDTISHIVTMHPSTLPEIDFEIGGFEHIADGIPGGCFTQEVNFSDVGGVEDPYTIVSWNWEFGDGTTSTEENPTHLYDEEGVYTVVLSTVSNLCCSGSDTLEIQMTNGLAIVSNDTLICQNGTATVFAGSEDGSSYSYDWSIPGSDDGNVQLVTDVSSAIWIYVTATNEYGCISPMDSILVEVRDPITLTISAPVTACLDEMFNVEVSVIGGDENYTYLWRANDEVLFEATSSINVNPSISTIYCVQVEDGCESTPEEICADVYVPEFPSFIVDTTNGCEPLTVTLIDQTGPFPGLNASTWYVEDSVYNESSATHTFLNDGSYDITLEVLSPEGCVSTTTLYNFITVHPIPTPNLYATPNPTNYFTTHVQLVNISPNATSSFTWYTPGALETENISDSSIMATYPELISDIYDAYMIETTEFGCVDSGMVQVVIDSDQLIFAPNVFTPNNDGMNDEWLPVVLGANPNDYLLQIYNRWGELVWKTDDLNAAWNGKFNGNLVKVDTYVWVIVTMHLDNDLKYRFEGTVSVLK